MAAREGDARLISGKSVSDSGGGNVCIHNKRHREIILIGHKGHPEVEGTSGRVKSEVILVQTKEDVAKIISLNNNRGVAFWKDDKEKRIFYTAGSYLFAVDAKSGKLIKE